MSITFKIVQADTNRFKYARPEEALAHPNYFQVTHLDENRKKEICLNKFCDK